jgi:hypothetical protein
MQNKQEETKPKEPASICEICKKDKTTGNNGTEPEKLINGLIYGLKPEQYKKYLRAYVRILNEMTRPETKPKNY